MDVEELKREVAKIKWFHRINLGNGVVTPGLDDSPVKLKAVGLPDSLIGLSVLDIGAWDGFFSFEAERRGASRVLAVDSYCWSGPGWGTKAGFDLARRALNSKVEDMEMEVFDLAPEKVGTFDLVLFLGVLYHMRHPLLALERVSSVTRKHVILETHVDLLDVERPAMAFYPEGELDGDTSNWCGPNPAMVVAMLKTVGFREFKMRPGTGYHPQTQTQGRMIFHAWK